MRCNQCEAAMINGLFCHELGCPNTWKRLMEERQEWVLFLKCFICGYEVEDGETCSCQEEVNQ